VQRVTDIIGEITAAAGEQSEGIGQVNTAVNQLDQMTQQNAALVEQSAAAAESLKDQASRLAEVIRIHQALLGDKVMLSAVLLSAVVAMVMGQVYYEPVLAVIGALAFAGIGVLAYLMAAKGTMTVPNGAGGHAGGAGGLAHPAGPWRAGVPLRCVRHTGPAAGLS
jgi:uncharacterized phage infection (PIP) family protein YhgE